MRSSRSNTRKRTEHAFQFSMRVTMTPLLVALHFLPKNMGVIAGYGIFHNLRQPSSYSYDMSLMKAFPLASEGKRYLQFRMEGRNILNIRGYGPYNTTIETKYFGLITSAGQSPRAIQVSARIVF